MFLIVQTHQRERQLQRSRTQSEFISICNTYVDIYIYTSINVG